MTHLELKRKVGYQEPDFKEKCGNCANCVRRANHLRCWKWGFAVVADGICRNGWEKAEAPYSAEREPLLVVAQALPEASQPKLLEYHPND